MSAPEEAREVVGREAELDEARAFLRSGSGPSALLIEGDAGIGKTTLWEAAVGFAEESGMRVLAARPNEAETRLSHAVLADLLDGVDSDDLTDVPERRRHALEVALLRVMPDSDELEPSAVPLGFVDALRGLAARAPIAVAIDDIQWIDAATAAALAVAVRRLKDESTRFVLAQRLGTSSPSLVRALERRGLARLQVDPLSFGATRRVLNDRLGIDVPRRTMRRIYDTARGNPLFAVELGRTLLDEQRRASDGEFPVPELVEDVLGVRIARTRSQVRDVLLAVALAGDVLASELRAIVGAAALEDAVRDELVTLEEGRVRASHPLLAASAKRDAPSTHLRALHLQLAAASGDEERTARHLALAAREPDEPLAARLETAAAAAAKRDATETAIELAEYAARLTPDDSEHRPDRLLALGTYLLRAGDNSRLGEILSPVVESLPTGTARAYGHRLLVAGAVSLDDYERHMERALAESTHDPALHASLLAERSMDMSAGHLERLADAERWARQASRLPGASSSLEVAHALNWLRLLRGRPIDGVEDEHDGGELYYSLERIAGIRLACRGEIPEARRTFERLLRRSEESDEAWSQLTIVLQVTEVELRAGNLDAAEHLLDEWDVEFASLTAHRPRCRAVLAAMRGSPEEAERWADEATVRAQALNMRWDLLEADRARGLAALQCGAPDRAAAYLRAIWEHTRREGIDEVGAFPVAADLVEALSESGELGDAREVTADLLALAEAQGHPWGSVSAARCQAVIDLAAGSGSASAFDRLAYAAAAYGDLGLHFDRARTLLTVGRMARRRRKWALAREALSSAALALEDMGASGWADTSRSELERLGGRRPSAKGELTPTERRVAELAAEGLSNNHIAATLFVAVHTVEVHLSHAYAKLGVRSRSQLAGALAALD